MDEVIDEAIAQLTPLIGVRAACRATGRPQANHYRRHRKSPKPPRPVREPTSQARALTADERAQVRALLNSEQHVDKAPAAVYHELLDEGLYLCSVATMYRILREHGEVRERRRQATHPARVKPERRPRHTDHPCRQRQLDGLQAGGVPAGRSGRDQEPLPSAHQQRQPLQRGGVQDPQNRPEFPNRFGSIEDARAFCRRFFGWYNTEHYHSGIAWHHPVDVHYGRSEAVQAVRADVLAAAYERHPERFVRKHPEPRPLPEAAWINKPPTQDQQPGETTRSTNP